MIVVLFAIVAFVLGVVVGFWFLPALGSRNRDIEKRVEAIIPYIDKFTAYRNGKPLDKEQMVSEMFEDLTFLEKCENRVRAIKLLEEHDPKTREQMIRQLEKEVGL